MLTYTALVTTPRRLLIDADVPGFYHLISRCVRRSWLCGQHQGKDYSHRRLWLIQRLNLLGRAFALDIHAYAIMSNHFHLVVYSDPKAPEVWADEEVVERWLSVCQPRTYRGEPDAAMAEHLRKRWLDDPSKLASLRQKLGSVSVFMKLLKQPIARRANLEDGCQGHFFEQRFYSGALLDDQAVIAAMAYVDLNPIRAKIARHIEACRDTSIEQRLRQNHETIEAYLLPVICGLTQSITVPITLTRYSQVLRGLAEAGTRPASLSNIEIWRQRLHVVRRRQRAYGAIDLITSWLKTRNLSLRERAFG